MDAGGIVFDESGEVWPGIEEACKACVVLCEEMDDCWQTEDSWGRLLTESFNVGGTGISGDVNALLSELLSLLLRYRLSWGVKCEDMDDCWRTEDSRDEFMTELFNGGETDTTGNENYFLFEWL